MKARNIVMGFAILLATSAAALGIIRSIDDEARRDDLRKARCEAMGAHWRNLFDQVWLCSTPGKVISFEELDKPTP